MECHTRRPRTPALCQHHRVESLKAIYGIGAEEPQLIPKGPQRRFPWTKKTYVLLEIGIEWKKEVEIFFLSVVGLREVCPWR